MLINSDKLIKDELYLIPAIDKEISTKKHSHYCADS